MKRTNDGYKIVLTADRSLMSEYAGNIFFGFSASAPRGFIPDWMYYRYVCPAVKADVNGEAVFAPYSLRKIEAALLRHGFAADEVIVAHPNCLDKVIGKKTEVVAITVMDPRGFGPVTSMFVNLFGGEAYDVYNFRKLMSSEVFTLYNPKIVVGGPGAWQLTNETFQKEFGIDTVIIGEAENIIISLFSDAVKRNSLPRLVEGTAVNVENIPNIVKPSICGLVEVARGCGRGCNFCSPTLLQFRCRDTLDIINEVKINVISGKKTIILHGEDVFRYKAHGVYPNMTAVEELFRSVCSIEGVKTVHVSHGCFASILSSPKMLSNISEIMKLDKNNWRAYEVGLETGSPRLVKKHMEGKCKPFKPQDWPEVVKQATKISNDANWIPVATLVMGLPEEEVDDVIKTLELVDDLKNYRIMLYPLFFVPIGRLSEEEYFTKEKMFSEHFELFFKCWERNLSQWPQIFNNLSVNYNFIEKFFVKLLLGKGISSSLKIIKKNRECLRTGEPFWIGRNKFKTKTISLPY